MEHLYGYTEKGEEFIFDRKTATPPHTLVIGKAGTGKTHMVKQEIVSNLLYGDSNDKIIVVDVNGEYRGLAEKYNGEIVDFTNTFINPCDLPLGSVTKEKIDMTDFLISFSEIISGKKISAEQEAVISETVSSMYRTYVYNLVIKTDRIIKRDECPTLVDFYDNLRRHFKETGRLLTAVKPYCNGLFDCFAHETNVRPDSRFIVIDLSSVNERRMTLSLHATLMHLWSVLIENNYYSEHTWIYFEDFHRYFKNPVLADTFLQIFRRARMQGGIITGVMQDIQSAFNSEQAKFMLCNTENLIFLSQNKSNAELLKEVYNIPDNLMNCITENTCKSGLMQFGRGEFIPFTQSVNENKEQ